MPAFGRFYGIDFSGANLAGDETWVAELVLWPGAPYLRLAGVADVSVRHPERAPGRHGDAIGIVLASRRALWGFDFPFGLPVELFPPGATWSDRFAFLRAWGDAYACGLERVRRAAATVGRKHVLRASEAEARTPFDAYHYRIIYQTFFGMRDVVGPLRRSWGTAVLPFQHRKLAAAERVVVECCLASVLKRARVPHHTYKQPAGSPLTGPRRLTRCAILRWLAAAVEFGGHSRLVMMHNPGWDALDAVIAAVGAARAVPAADHRAVVRHPRFTREGRLYV